MLSVGDQRVNLGKCRKFAQKEALLSFAESDGKFDFYIVLKLLSGLVESVECDAIFYTWPNESKGICT